MSKDSQATGQSSGQGKQQSSEIAQDRTSTQQGGRSAQQGSGQNYQPGSQGSGWQRFPGSALASRRGSSAVSPYGAFGSGPFSTMRRITEEMDRLFDSFGFGRSFFPSEFGQGAQSGYADPQRTAALWAPHVDVVERDGKLLISADLPGVKKEDVKVEINQDSVTIQGQRHQESTSSDRGYYQSERSYGSFYRSILLPEGANTESASATFRDGVLQIEVQAPSQQARGRTLEIKDAGGSSATGTGSKNGGQQQQR
jgi:HSP20 family protein